MDLWGSSGLVRGLSLWWVTDGAKGPGLGPAQQGVAPGVTVGVFGLALRWRFSSAFCEEIWEGRAAMLNADTRPERGAVPIQLPVF